jgi:hypothetical protein
MFKAEPIGVACASHKTLTRTWTQPCSCVLELCVLELPNSTCTRQEIDIGHDPLFLAILFLDKGGECSVEMRIFRGQLVSVFLQSIWND